MRTKKVTISEVEFVAFKTAEIVCAWNEPLPPFITRYPNRLEECLSIPFQALGGKDLYRGIKGKAAIMFYMLSRSNHAFVNGNKRMAVMILLTLLYKNGYWVRVHYQEMYRFAVSVAESKKENRDSVIKQIELFIEKNIVRVR